MPRPIEGWLALPEGPGLGIEVDERALRRFAVDGA
jgi:L-alanine-DL-glutamate epimerase-like enolase superfamily enzyme